MRGVGAFGVLSGASGPLSLGSGILSDGCVVLLPDLGSHSMNAEQNKGEKRGGYTFESSHVLGTDWRVFIRVC